MKTAKLVILFAIFSLLPASAALAADDGNTKPRLNNATVNSISTTADIINQTSVVGNVKGVSCRFAGPSGANLIFTVNGASSQTISVSGDFPDADGNTYSGWIPMNIRFSSSIRVQIQYTGWGYESTCTVSWALD